jgi:hypothetical protein
MFSPLAVTSSEFIGLVCRVGKLLTWFLLPVDSSHCRLPSRHDLVSSCYCCRVAALASTGDCRQRRPSWTPPTGREVRHARSQQEIRSATLYVNTTSWLAAKPRHCPPGRRWRGEPKIAHNESRRPLYCPCLPQCWKPSHKQPWPSRADTAAASTFSADHSISAVSSSYSHSFSWTVQSHMNYQE